MAIAVCDLTDCIEMTEEFIKQQTETEIICGDWQVGRFAWKLENVQPIDPPIPLKGQQGLWNVNLADFVQERAIATQTIVKEVAIAIGDRIFRTGQTIKALKHPDHDLIRRSPKRKVGEIDSFSSRDGKKWAIVKAESGFETFNLEAAEIVKNE